MTGKADALRSNQPSPALDAARSPGLDPGAASVKPKVVETKPKKPSRSRRVSVDEDEPDLIAAK
jgi:hypothetical protein